MSTAQEDMDNILQRISAGAAPDVEFAVEWSRSYGRPLLWEERISIRQGHHQSYSTLRNFVDAGGAPIGKWETQTDPRAVQSLARELLYARIWELTSPSTESGGEKNIWSYRIGEYDGALSIPSTSDMLLTMSDVDIQMRSVANTLVASKSGASVLCHLNLIEPSENWVYAQIAMVNEGKWDCVIQNPFILSKANAKTDFIRVEVGAPPVREPGVTSSGIQYIPLPMPEPAKLVTPWNEEYVILHAGEGITCPQKVNVNLSTYRGYFIRAVYSHYGTPAVPHELPLVRGRVFSPVLPL
jgi:hypothetical protein